MPPKLMRDLKWRETSGVDRAANLAEGWLMMKSVSPAARSLLTDALFAANGVDPASARRTENMPFDKAAIEADPNAALAYIAGLEKALASNAAPATEPTEAEVLAKSLESLPESVRTVLLKSQRDAAEAQDEVRKERTRRELDEFTTVAKSFDSLPDVTDSFAEVMVKARHGDADSVDALIEALRKANAVVKSSGAFREIGSNAAAPESPEGRLEALAKSFTEADKTLSYEQAIEKAAGENPELYAEYRSDVNRKNRS